MYYVYPLMPFFLCQKRRSLSNEHSMKCVTVVVMSLPDGSPDCPADSPRLDFPVNEMPSLAGCGFVPEIFTGRVARTVRTCVYKFPCPSLTANVPLMPRLSFTAPTIDVQHTALYFNSFKLRCFDSHPPLKRVPHASSCVRLRDTAPSALRLSRFMQ